ncbi:HAD-IA family hydrolase [Mucilaginibacter sp. ZT4R22]|uniref:HAD-IA family hydrolase n=1 Tax=Mucilaginibacter pankratovii TaxID=2772110 RepID=A0ABR7WN72_9SPHI|nr:HAD-IA family hydrolase [Mucilaginibacter pankratovii]MBD1363778.1 HAD-IA family hydrolase [Mucilaginibacter pankratovii]
MSIKLVVFDMAGTTVKDENKVTETFRLALEKYGYHVTYDAINPLMGYEKSVAITKMLHRLEPDTQKITPDLIKNIHQEFIALMINYYKKAPALEALPNAEKTIATLRKTGIKIGVNTGFSKDIAETIIERLQWCEKGLIDYLIGSDEVENGRPDPAMINRMMKLARITDPQEVAKVGDTEVDIREGQNAGCKYVIAVTTGAFTRTELEPYHPTHILDDIAGVLDIVLN